MKLLVEIESLNDAFTLEGGGIENVHAALMKVAETIREDFLGVACREWPPGLETGFGGGAVVATAGRVRDPNNGEKVGKFYLEFEEGGEE